MNSLQDFSISNDGEITLCEVDGRIHAMQYECANVSAFTTAIDRHPRIQITRDMIHPAKSLEESKALFLPVDVPFFKQLIQAYYEQGFTEALEMLSTHQQKLLATSAQLLLRGIEQMNKVRCAINPSLSTSSEYTIEKYSQTREWLRNPIRCVAWHNNFTKIAVAACDDTVRIYIGDSNMIPILKCKQQKNVTCLAWRPMSNSDIAVGCESVIIIWNVDPNSVVTRPSTNHAIILHRIEHKPVISIGWSPRGDILASVAACDSKILLWDVELDRTSSLKRPGASGHCLLKWSPNGDKLFVSTTSTIFRVWECNSWQAERWNVLTGFVQSACWSKCGTSLLFTTNEEPIIYSLSFTSTDFVFKSDFKSAPNQAVPIYDVSKVDIEGNVVGGIVQCMEWDCAGNHLAVLFRDTNSVAVFYVMTTPVLQLTPGYLISGRPNESPSTINFQPSFENGSCLSIGWSSGRLQHFPIVYTDFPNKSPSNNQQTFYDSFSLTSPIRNSTYFVSDN